VSGVRLRGGVFLHDEMVSIIEVEVSVVFSFT
jgi:hypothetical protein